jgi:hypothetical protein
MVKMGALGARDLVLSLHRFPENNFTEEQSWDSFEQTLRRLCQQGEKCGLLLHLRLAPAKPPRNLAEALRFIDKVGAKNLRLAPSVALAGSQEGQIPADKLGMWLISGTASDITGTVWNWNAPVAASEQGRQLSPLLSAGPEVPLVLDATYINQEAEYHDIKVLEQLATARAR